MAFSPDGREIAYTIVYRDRPGRPYSQIWVMNVATRKSTRLGGAQEATGDPLWSPDGKWIAYFGSAGGHEELKIAHPDGTGTVELAPVEGTNAPLPHTGNEMTWAPDGKQIAFVSATPGPETAAAAGDPMVFTRYLWRPTAGEGLNPYNDNRRLHIFVVNVATRQVKQLTSGDKYEHSIDWSPDGSEILFLSNRDPNSDEFFHYDVFALRVADGSIRRLTASEACAYVPVWSPDGKTIAYLGTKGGLTDRETTMEDTHVWLMDADGSHRREIGEVVDDRQGNPVWAPDGSAVYFAAQERGSVHLLQAVDRGRRARESGGPGRFCGFVFGGKEWRRRLQLREPGRHERIFLESGRGDDANDRLERRRFARQENCAGDSFLVHQQRQPASRGSVSHRAARHVCGIETSADR
ncbi:MAG: PD40 domain-containing protein [Acidobacteriota bacterium]|nr:PD40 domain-containing protein [Acidobacteriota bacterium]